MDNNEAWNIRPDIIGRQNPEMTTYVFFCEDEVSECIYLRSLQIPNVLKINVIEKQGQGVKNVFSAIEKCHQDGLLLRIDQDRSRLSDENLNVWCIFDRDSPNYTDVEFNSCPAFAQMHEVKVAWSNDAFELWLLLHFKDVDAAQVRYQNRETYQLELVESIRECPDILEEIREKMDRDNFSYDFFKRRVNFTQHLLPLLKDDELVKIQLAVTRSQALASSYTNENYSERRPCTMMHEVVDQLLSFHREPPA